MKKLDLLQRTVFHFRGMALLIPGALLLISSLSANSQCYLQCPPDTETTCDQLSPDVTGMAELIGCSGFASYWDELQPIDDCHSLIIRHWSSSGYTCTQEIFVTDNLPPVFLNVPADLSLDCGDPLPEPAACPAVDQCGVIDAVSTLVGGTGGIIQSCGVTTAVGPGPDWSFWLPDLSPAGINWHFSPAGHFEAYGDGTAHLWGTIVNANNPNQGFEVSLWFQNGMNWDTWSALGRSYKNDLNLAGDNYLDWTYYEMADGFSHLTGIGEFAGSELLLTHFPPDYYFGFQVGVAANIKNSNYGISGWMEYTGWLNDEWVSGNADINADLTCEDIPEGCANTTVTYTWMATDACGYTAFAEQHIAVTDTAAPSIDDYEATIYLPCESYEGIFITASDDCSIVVITYWDEVTEPGCNGSVIRHYTVSDACGNSVTAVQTIDLYGESEPYFTVFPSDH